MGTVSNRRCISSISASSTGKDPYPMQKKKLALLDAWLLTNQKPRLARRLQPAELLCFLLFSCSSPATIPKEGVVLGVLVSANLQRT